MKHVSDRLFYRVFIGAAIFAVIMVALASCATYKKFAKYGDCHTDSAASYCASKFPVKVETVTNTITKEGTPWIKEVPGETVYINCDSAIASAWDEAARKHIGVQCPPSKIIYKTDTVCRTVIKTEENTARVAYLQNQLDAQTKLSEKYKAGEDSSRALATKEGIALGLLALTLGISGYFHLKNSFKKIV